GLALPVFASELARERLSKRHLQRATALAKIYDPAGAVDAGFLDRAVPSEQVEAAALEAAATLAALPAQAHALTKRALRRTALETIRASLG
ncbi:MAG TPA: enoyl-CoA hydratase-related protein, partial [Myxococcota bacterium]|nr:enoyl-CoA hydratase-related protein [Myxococcota bacterium]